MDMDRMTVTTGNLSNQMEKLSRPLEWLRRFFLMIFRKAVSLLSPEIIEAEAAETEAVDETAERRKILVSACLYGGTPVQSDGQDISLQDRIFQKWKKEGRLIPVCPEVEGGLSVPRQPAERSGKRVVTADGQDVTSAYHRGSALALWLARSNDVAFAVFKENSPACGSTYIYNGQFTGSRIHGEGTAVEFLRNAGISVFNENELLEADSYLTAVEEKGWDQEQTAEVQIRSGITRVM